MKWSLWSPFWNFCTLRTSIKTQGSLWIRYIPAAYHFFINNKFHHFIVYENLTYLHPLRLIQWIALQALACTHPVSSDRSDVTTSWYRSLFGSQKKQIQQRFSGALHRILGDISYKFWQPTLACIILKYFASLFKCYYIWKTDVFIFDEHWLFFNNCMKALRPEKICFYRWLVILPDW